MEIETEEKDIAHATASNHAQSPFLRLAKEFLRQSLIGKQVRLLCEYQKKSKHSAHAKPHKFAAVFVQQQQYITYNAKYCCCCCCCCFFFPHRNIAVALVRAGLAEVAQHKPHEPKSMAYLELQKAEQEAKKDKKGIYGEEVPFELWDHSEDHDSLTPNVMRRLEEYLRGQKRKVVVDFVFSGDRFKIHVPEQKCLLPFGLANVHCDPYYSQSQVLGFDSGRAAYLYTKRRILQKDVEVELTQVYQKELIPIWFGKVYVDGVDLGLELLQKGLAKVANLQSKSKLRPGSSNTSSVPPGYAEAEAAACKALVGRWESVMARAKQKKEEGMKRDKRGQELTVSVSHIDSAVQFWINTDDGNRALERLEEQMSRLQHRRARD
ncbi:hypothetical protein RFI_07090, partial [Reticulomyxa filosa]